MEELYKKYVNLEFRYKVLITLVTFLIGWLMFLSPYFMQWNINHPVLSLILQAAGSVVWATVAGFLVQNILIKPFEQVELKHVLTQTFQEALADNTIATNFSKVFDQIYNKHVNHQAKEFIIGALNSYVDQKLPNNVENAFNQRVIPIDCSKCTAIRFKCLPHTINCIRTTETLSIDESIQNAKGDEIELIYDYDIFIARMRCLLMDSTESYHLMPLSEESVRNFYDSKVRGEAWLEAQKDWAQQHGKEGIKRVALINANDLKDPAYKEALIRLLKVYNEFCDLRVIFVHEIIKSNPSFIARDFGIFLNNNIITSALFTFISVYKGNTFVKSAGHEYFTKSVPIMSSLHKYFLELWGNGQHKTQSDIILQSLGVYQ